MTIKDDDIVTKRVKSRRSFLSKVGVAVGGAVAAIAVSKPAVAKDARDFVPADNKAKSPHDSDRRSGDMVG